MRGASRIPPGVEAGEDLSIGRQYVLRALGREATKNRVLFAVCLT